MTAPRPDAHMDDAVRASIAMVEAWHAQDADAIAALADQTAPDGTKRMCAHWLASVIMLIATLEEHDIDIPAWAAHHRSLSLARGTTTE